MDKIAQVTLDVFVREFVPGSDLPANLAVEPLDLPNDQCNKFCEVANSIFSQIPVQVACERLVARTFWSSSMSKFGGTNDTHQNIVVYNVGNGVQRDSAIEPALNEDVPKKRKRRGAKDTSAESLRVTLCIDVTSEPDDSPFVVPVSMQDGETMPDDAAGKPKILSDSVATMQGCPTPATTNSASGTPLTSLRLETEGGKRGLERLVNNVYQILRQQFLVHFFTVFACRDHAWLLRWDRAGLVISEPFNFIKEPLTLYTFLYRFACMNDAQRGRDLTVVPASEEEVELMRSVDKFETQWHESQFAATLVPGWPIYKILVPEHDVISKAVLRKGSSKAQGNTKGSRNRVRRFLVGAPCFMNKSVMGRATRCHIAYDVAEDRLVFFKEYWRTDTPTSHPEGEVYLRLHSKNVNYIATPLAAGDVRVKGGRVHQTRSQDFIKGSDPKLVQYRLLLKEIARPLKDYEDSLQLVEVIYQCLRAHEEAWERAGVLHADISTENLLIQWYMENGELKYKALLADWGLCKYIEEMDQPVVKASRCGTWPFISALLLFYPTRFVQGVSHDLESFIHVLHWMCLKFHNTDYSRIPLRLRRHVAILYNERDGQVQGQFTGGFEKMKHMQDGRIPFELEGGSAKGKGVGLHMLLGKLAALYKEHYAWLKPQFPSSNPPTSLKRSVLRVSVVRGQLPPVRDSAPEPDLEEATTVEKPAKPVLQSHKQIIAVFGKVLAMAEDGWILDKKTEDKFAPYRSDEKTASKVEATLSGEAESSEEHMSVEGVPSKRVRKNGNSTAA